MTTPNKPKLQVNSDEDVGDALENVNEDLTNAGSLAEDGDYQTAAQTIGDVISELEIIRQYLDNKMK